MMNRHLLLALLLLCCFRSSPAAAADPPCNQYPHPQQPRCEKLWKQLNQESVAEISRFGLDQLKRRQEGKISQEQHLKENMEFIKQSTDKRLKLLSERMAQDQDPRQHPAEKPLQR
ncbi:MAG: hypothetical protein EPO61_10765 [Nitrospirae bacterium]|nr:MAG: hypothetical protein EPO61_10765 [Nitrospirota bacterium]